MSEQNTSERPVTFGQLTEALRPLQAELSTVRQLAEALRPEALRPKSELSEISVGEEARRLRYKQKVEDRFWFFAILTTYILVLSMKFFYY